MNTDVNGGGATLIKRKSKLLDTEKNTSKKQANIENGTRKAFAKASKSGKQKTGIKSLSTSAVTENDSERNLLHRTRLAVVSQGWPCWRNNSGVDVNRWVRYGLGVGSADLIACVAGNFVGIEIKSPGKKPGPKQIAWKQTVEKAKGYYWLIAGENDLERLCKWLVLWR